jgi:wyosine [tRNA(Phe)-imidazoG37] synthetase (radical SAM superfamily)
MISMRKNFKYIYGPVFSWRLGRSLGIDLISQEQKVCTFNCIYCQLGDKTNFTRSRKVYIRTAAIIQELKSLPHLKINYITFSGKGEPTLARNLGQTIRAIKNLRIEPVAVLTNSSLFNREDVRRDLAEADFVIAKLDVCSQASLGVINQPLPGLRFRVILNAIKEFRADYHGRLGLQIMFVKENRDKAKELLRICRLIQPDEIQINTPFRACAVKPLSRKEVARIKKHFLASLFGVRVGRKGIKVVSVYDRKHPVGKTPCGHVGSLRLHR